MGFTPVLAFARVLDRTGAPVAGQLSLTLSATISDGSTTITPGGLCSTALDATGSGALVVPANDDSTTSPSGTTYALNLRTLSGDPFTPTAIVVPHSTGLATLLSGVGAPGSGVGVVGNWYLDTAAGVVYPAKTVAGWSTTPTKVALYAGQVPAGVLDLATVAPAQSGTPSFSYILSSALGAPNGVARLDQAGQVPASELGNVLGNISTIPAMNMAPANLPNWRKAVANARAGLGSSKVLMIGTSITWGTGTPNMGLNSVAAYLNASLNAIGIPSQQSFGVITPSTNLDTRFTLGSGWGLSGIGFGIGWGNCGYAYGAAGIAGALTFAPAGNVDTFDIWWVGGSVTGTVQASVDGGSTTAVATNGASQVNKTTVTCPAGTAHVLSLGTITTGPVLIIGVDAYLSTQKGLHLGNAGIPSLGTVAGWSAATSGSSLACIEAYAPSLTLIELGADDALVSGATSLATYTADLQAIITAAKLSGDVLLWTQPLSLAGGTLDPTVEAQYSAAMITLAAINSCGVVDIGSRFGPWSVSNANGFMGDSYHPNTLGNADIAGAISDALVSVTGAGTATPSSTTLNQRGNWAATTAYVVNDVVEIASGTYVGGIYYCATAHTSGASFPGPGTNWTQIQAPTAFAAMSSMCGTGQDGVVTLDGTTSFLGFAAAPVGNVYTLTRSIHATTLTINAGVTLKPNGFPIFATTLITGAGTIDSSGGNASGVNGATAGASANTAANLYGSTAGSSGVVGVGVAGVGLIGGGSSGAGGTGTSGAGGAAGNPAYSSAVLTNAWLSPFPLLVGTMGGSNVALFFRGGCLGGTGAGDGTNKGGASGGGGGIITLFCPVINFSGTIQANGGNGGTPTTGNCGGGGGSGGGAVVGYTAVAWTVGTAQALGGTHGNGVGTGTNGGNGSAGIVQNVVM